MTLQKVELLIASVFPISEVPKTILVYRAENLPENEAIQSARKVWAFSELAAGVLASFQPPPDEFGDWSLKQIREPLWKYIDTIEGKNTQHLVKELLRRCLEPACRSAGLVWCNERMLFYFPTKDNPQRRIAYTNSDGERTTVSVAGIRTYGSGERAAPYHYQLAPVFRVGFDNSQNLWVTTRIYARVTDANGIPFTGKLIGKRRRHLAKSWWNQHWLARTLGIMQALTADGERIVVGPEGRQVVIIAKPMTWECPVSIDEAAVARLGHFQEELASLQFTETEEDETPASEDVNG